MRRIFVVGLLVSACASGPGPAGHLEVALVGTGLGGTTYRLPANTMLAVTSDTFSEQVPVDGAGDSVTIEVTPGEYSISLINPAGLTTSWPLARTLADGTTTVVQGTLDPLPNITVTENVTTDLSITFHVADAESVVFAHGAIHVAVDIDESTASAYEIDMVMPALEAAGVFLDASAPALLAARMPADGDVGMSVTVQARTTGPWTQVNGITACARVQIVSLAADGQTGLADELAESNGTAQACIQQVSDTAADVLIATARVGDATTPTFADLGATSYELEAILTASVSANVFDGTTLHLGALQGTQDVPVDFSPRVSASDGPWTLGSLRYLVPPTTW